MVVVIRSKIMSTAKFDGVDGSGFPIIERRMERCAVWEWVNPPSAKQDESKSKPPWRWVGAMCYLLSSLAPYGVALIRS